MNIKTLSIAGIALLALLSSCKKEEPELGPAPTEADAAFTYTPSAANPNIIDFSATNTQYRVIWDLGNGSIVTEENNTSGTYPYAGTYTVTLTVFTQGGSASSSQNVVIENDDLSLLDDPLYNALTGGADGPGSRTWMIDSVSAGHFGVGPDPESEAGAIPEWYAAAPLDKAGAGMYDDRYVFSINAFKYDMITNGDVYIHNSLAGEFPGSYENLGDFTAPYPDQLDETWTITIGEDTTLELSGNSFMGFYSGVKEYRIIKLNDTALWVQYKHHEGGLHWYMKYIPEGFESSGGGGGDPVTYTLPIDFESEDPVFNTFGGSTYSVIDNPDPSGVNTSARVAETVHGVEPWAGLFVDLTDPLDLSTNSVIAFKLWAPEPGAVRIKLENSADGSQFVELDTEITVGSAWEEVSIDFAGSESGLYDRLVIFPGWDVPSAGTFYFDDLEQQ